MFPLNDLSDGAFDFFFCFVGISPLLIVLLPLFSSHLFNFIYVSNKKKLGKSSNN